MNNYISSIQNPLIKEFLLLKEKSRARKKSGNFIVEGNREIQLALEGNYQISNVLVDHSIFNTEQNSVLNELKNQNAEITEISHPVYEKLAYRGSTEGIIAMVKSKDLSIHSLKLNNKNPLILVAEAPEKPGNIGALLRTADAAGIDAIFIANPLTDMYNPNVIRSSVGCIFTTNIATGTTEEILAYLKSNNISCYGAALTASVPYDSIDYSKPSAIIVGTESTGLSNEWLNNTEKNIIIPMRGSIDSMNVSVSAAVIIFEAVRQREKK